MKKLLLVLSLLIFSLMFIVACSVEKTESEFESQLAELSDEELAEVGEIVSQEDPATAGQAVRSRFGLKTGVKSLSKEQMNLIMSALSQRLRKKATIPCVAILQEGETCMKHCECVTGICGWSQPFEIVNDNYGKRGVPTGPGELICETPNQREEPCLEEIECADGLDCEGPQKYIGRKYISGRTVDQRYNTLDELYDDDAHHLTTETPFCQ